jgi:Zn finger protein HypA/HybF involved in hydrogenase expression
MEEIILDTNECERCEIDLTQEGSHYHCGRCKSKDVTSMMGHYTKLSGETEWSFKCKPEDLDESS